MSDDENNSRSSPCPEKCFYASFKIFLNPDSRKNSDTGSEDLDDLFSGTGEVVRIEKTLEVSDDNTSDEEEKTLSLSNENMLHDPLEETDNDEDPELKMYTEILPPLVVINSHPERAMKRSISESEDLPQSNRMSRSSERNGSSRRRESRYESTQSMDRYQRDRSPVFYLNPGDWIRTEGSSPLPYKEKQPNPLKLLDSLGKNLDILTESEENLNTELEQINSQPINVKNLRTKSDPVRYQTPTLELIRESSITPEPPTRPCLSRSCTPGIRSRSSTPGRTLFDRQRKTAIPILCSRSARMVDYISPCPSPLPHQAPELEALGLMHSSRPSSACGRLSRGMNYKSLSNLGKISQEDVTKFKFGGGLASSHGSLLSSLGNYVSSLVREMMHPFALTEFSLENSQDIQMFRNHYNFHIDFIFRLGNNL